MLKPLHMMAIHSWIAVILNALNNNKITALACRSLVYPFRIFGILNNFQLIDTDY